MLELTLYGIVYGLYDPRTGDLRYIGQTTRTLKERLKYHLSKHNLASASYSARWLASLQKIGLRPDVSILGEAYSRVSLDSLEIRLISESRARGNRLTNLASGGMGSSGYTLGPDFALGVSKRMRGKPKSPETKLKLSNANKGNKPSDETRNKISIALTGRKLPEKERIRLVNIAATAFKGRKHTKKWKVYMSSIMKGRNRNTPEHMSRLHEARRGTHPSLESRARMSASAKARCLVSKRSHA